MPDQVAPPAAPAAAPEPQVPVYDLGTKQEIYVPASDAEAGIQAGRYNRLANTVATVRAAGGQTIVRKPTQAVGERAVSNLEATNKADEAARLHSFDGVLTGAEVYVDSLLDAASMGAIHEHGEVAELKHRAHPGADYAGSLTAFAIPGEGVLGDLKKFTPLGQAEKGLAKVAAGLIPQAESTAGRILTAGAREAVTNAGLIAGYDVIHQASDALIDDKQFSGEHVAAQIPLGLLLGGAFGAAGEYVNKFAEHEATAKALRDQGGVVNPKSTVSAQVHGEIAGAIQEWDAAVKKRGVQADLMRELIDSGSLKDVPASYMDRVDAAREAASRARKALDRIDLEGALSSGSPAEISRAAQAVSAYEASAAALDHALAPSQGELGLAAPAKAGEFTPQPGPAYDHVSTGHGGPVMDQAAFDLDARMSDPEMRQRYREIYGKDYEFMPGNSPEERAAQGQMNAAPDLVAQPDNLGGKITPTSEKVTGGLKGRRGGIPVEDVEGFPPTPEGRADLQYGHEAQEGPIPVMDVYGLGDADTRAEPARPEPPPGIVEKLDGGKKAKLEDGSVVWRSEHRKMVKEYEAKLADWEKQRAAARPEPTTKVIPRERPSVAAGGLDELNKQLGLPTGPSTKIIPESFESPGSLRRTLHEASPLGKQVGEQAAIDKAAAKAEGKTPTMHDPMPLGAQVGDAAVKGPAAPLRPVRSEPNARQFFEQLAQHGPVPSPGDRAVVRIDAHLRKLEAATGGKLTAARSLEVAQSLGVKAPGSRLADQMVQLWSVRRLAETAAEAAQGTARGPANKLIRKMAANGVAALGLKHMGPAGFVMGHALGWAANAGAVAGKAKLAVKQVAQMLLKNKRAAIIARTMTQAHDKSDHHYGVQVDSLQDRAEQIARAAMDADITRQRIRESLGDLPDKSPDLASQIMESTMNRLQNLSKRLPAFNSRTGHTSVQDERRFEIYEEATWHPEVILDAIARGEMTPVLATALAEQHPHLQRVLMQELMGDPDQVRSLSNKMLRQVELITGLPLTRASDPGFLLRQQMSAPTSTQAVSPGAPQGGSGPAQRFKITAPPPLPSQAAGLNGRAPGN